MWQDSVIGIISIIFTFCLIPQASDVMRGKSKMNPTTSIITTWGLVIMAFTFITLDLWFSAVITFTTAIVWSSMLFPGVFKSSG